MERQIFNFSVQWHLTSNCINRCRHCYMYDDRYVAEDCSYENFVAMFQNVKEFFDKYGLTYPNFVLTGGSPLMNPECDKILRFLCSMVDGQLMLLDIPEVLTDSKIALLKECRVSDYQMSLDGMKDMHDYIRGKGSFDRTIEACRRLNAEGIRPHIMYTVSIDNCGQLLALCEYLVQTLDVFTFAFDFVVPYGNAAKNNSYISNECADDILEKYYDFAKKHSDTNRIFGLKPSRYRVYEKMKRNEPMQSVYSYPMMSGCHIGWDSICVLQNGDVLPCRRLPIVLGNLAKDSFEDILLSSELLRKFRRFSLYQEKCGGCQYGVACRGCPAITYALTGDCLGTYPLCTYEPDVESAPRYHAPDMNCSKETELEFIKTSMNNYISINSKHLFEVYPELIRYMRSYKRIQSQKDYHEWVKLYNTLKVDEECCLSRWVYSQRE
ncbi:MAG: radical SAM protein [Lachnospiraceae bacterium]|nr:radical SAM protein [Lachnospiraceae bacterium]